VPSHQTIFHVLQHELGFTRKRLTVAAQAKQVRYLEEIADFPARNINFMDKCSIDRTTGSGTHGHSLSGEPTIQICRYSSNVKFTVNLLCGLKLLLVFTIIKGASNGLELLQFFIEEMDERYDNGIQTIAAGHVVLMDNCSFHHARHVEPILRQILLEYEVTLVLLPPYSPELNPCEYAFNHITAT
jgi:hypothetical protein